MTDRPDRLATKLLAVPSAPLTPILASGLRQADAIGAALPPDAKFALILAGDTEDDAVVIGAAGRVGDHVVLTTQVEVILRNEPRAKFFIGAVFK